MLLILCVTMDQRKWHVCNDYCHCVCLIVETSGDNFLTRLELHHVPIVLITRGHVWIISVVSTHMMWQTCMLFWCAVLYRDKTFVVYMVYCYHANVFLWTVCRAMLYSGDWVRAQWNVFCECQWGNTITKVLSFEHFVLHPIIYNTTYMNTKLPGFTAVVCTAFYSVQT